MLARVSALSVFSVLALAIAGLPVLLLGPQGSAARLSTILRQSQLAARTILPLAAAPAYVSVAPRRSLMRAKAALRRAARVKPYDVCKRSASSVNQKYWRAEHIWEYDTATNINKTHGQAWPVRSEFRGLA
ncbi:hypothetical protein HETIRDRAFT_118867 [Heterobasidion irregulare TC 32-1]|uniref:Uncharacterized protein n=1 Tax=Heterobasidion irregulare (strain TC 32-1) TaxID=747525 RepID=W4JU70_HETIT|nr:uncharacterized protein HETIRDRAFT_118867 [Heterobasidion irregulare TC 32-1]ETW76635.1 hypothetical protein HETIRDRAFT_118867 [Heterobasidion irregulare TC 32-1]